MSQLFLLLFYTHTHTFCHFDYACTSWFTNIPKPLKTKLQTSQNKLVRLLLNLPYRTHLTPAHFTKLGWLRVEERVHQLAMCLVFRILRETVPKYLSNYFTRVSDAHRYFTRGSSSDLVPPKFKTLMGKNAFYYFATTQWNALPTDLKIRTSLLNFKTAIKSWLNSTST